MKKTIGDKINEFRKLKNMTQDELAEQMGVSPQAVSKWEKDLSIPDLPILIELADFFHITLDDLVREKDTTVTLVPKECRKDINRMFLKVNVLSTDGDKVKVNLPLAFVKLVADSNIALPEFKGSDALKDIDLNAVISIIESGIIGKIVEVESKDGDTVEIMVEES